VLHAEPRQILLLYKLQHIADALRRANQLSSAQRVQVDMDMKAELGGKCYDMDEVERLVAQCSDTPGCGDAFVADSVCGTLAHQEGLERTQHAMLHALGYSDGQLATRSEAFWSRLRADVQQRDPTSYQTLADLDVESPEGRKRSRPLEGRLRVEDWSAVQRELSL
jgi:hypothetical protein